MAERTPAHGDSLVLTSTRDGAVRLSVSARPQSPRSGVAGVRAGALRVLLAAPPVDGAANAELVATLASALSVPRRQVTVVHGEHSRTKVVEVRGLTVDAVRARLLAPEER